MDEDIIKSLCVSVLNKSGQPRLFRFADLVDDVFIRYNFGSQLKPSGINTDQIFCRDADIVPEGTVDLWKWYSPDGVRQFLRKMSEKSSWIEYVKLPDVSSVEELRVALQNGVEFEFSSKHNYLIEFFKTDNMCKCIFCESNNFVIKNNKYVLRENIYHLDCFQIPEEDIFKIETDLLPEINKWLYSKLNLPKSIGQILVKTPAETAKTAILKRIQRCTEGFSKLDKRVIADFIRSLSTENIINQVATECKCTEDESREYISYFVGLCDKYFVEEDITNSALTRLIETNSNIADRFQILIQKHWEATNAEQIANADKEKQRVQEELFLMQKQVDSLVNECTDYEKIKKETEIKIAELEEVYNQKIALADDIAEKIRNRIIDAKNDLSLFFSEYAIFSEKSVAINKGIDEKYTFYYGKTLEKDVENLVKMNDVIHSLKENLEAVGVDKNMCFALASFLLSAYYTKTPLILAGYGSENIANAVSATLYNKMADTLYLTQETFRIDIDKSSVIAIHNGFRHINRVLNDLNGTYSYFICQTSEELLLEPRSIYNYALPIFVEYFITENKLENLYGTFSSVTKDFSEKARNIPLPEYIVPPLAYRNLCNLIACSKKLYDGLSEMDVHLLTTLPVMCSLGKTNDLLEIMSLFNLSDKEKVKLLTYIGEK